ncbi:MAG: hypothetical protein ACOCT9_01205 [archaeon]
MNAKGILKLALSSGPQNPNWPPEDFNLKDILKNKNKSQKKKAKSSNDEDFIKDVTERLKNRKKSKNEISVSETISEEVSSSDPSDVDVKALVGGGTIGGTTGVGLGHLYDRKQDKDSKKGKMIGGAAGIGLGVGIGHLLSKRKQASPDIPLRKIIEKNPELAEKIKNNPGKIEEYIEEYTGNNLPIEKSIDTQVTSKDKLKKILMGSGIGSVAGTSLGHLYDKRQGEDSKKGKAIGGAAGAGIGSGIGYLLNKKASKDMTAKEKLKLLIKTGAIDPDSVITSAGKNIPYDEIKKSKNLHKNVTIPGAIQGAGAGALLGHIYDKNKDEDSKKGKILGGITGAGLGASIKNLINKKAAADEAPDDKLTPEAKKRKLQANLAAAIPFSAMAGAGIGTGRFQDNRLKGTLLGGLAGAGLGTGVSFLGDKINNKLVEGLAKKTNYGKKNVKNLNEAAKKEALLSRKKKNLVTGLLSAGLGYGYGRGAAKAEDALQNIKSDFDGLGDELKQTVKRHRRKVDSIDLNPSNYSFKNASVNKRILKELIKKADINDLAQLPANNERVNINRDRRSQNKSDEDEDESLSLKRLIRQYRSDK